MELGDIIKWVDDKNLCLGNNRFDFFTEGGQEQINVNPKEYISEYKEYKYLLIGHMLRMDLENKKALVRRLFRRSCLFFERCCKRREETNDGLWLFTMKTSVFHEIAVCDDTPIQISSAVWEQMCLEHELANFYEEVLQLCQECKLNPVELFPVEYKGLDDVFADMILFAKKTPTEEQAKYNTLQRTYRIAAVKMLLESTGVSKGIDKTKIAAFVEAVTGGNIETEPQNTVSYKEPTKPAKEAAAVWLGRIGVKTK